MRVMRFRAGPQSGLSCIICKELGPLEVTSHQDLDSWIFASLEARASFELRATRAFELGFC